MKKVDKLKKIIRGIKRVVVAYSGGADSTFLLKVSLDAVGRENVLAVIAGSDTFPKREYAHAKILAKRLAAGFMTIHTKETENESFLKNPINRCYYCKKELFGRMKEISRKKGFNAVIDGSNYDDRKDLRYGRQAGRELGVRSPLAEARIGKGEIRKLSKKLKLSTWSKPSFACLASRFPYHSRITSKKLKKVDAAEIFLQKCGFRQVRVRAHNNIARIEVPRSDIKRILSKQKLQKDIARRLKRLGFSYVTLDLEGYRTGSMNEVLRTGWRLSSK